MNMEDPSLAGLYAQGRNNGSILDVTIDCRNFRRLFSAINIRLSESRKTIFSSDAGVMDLQNALYRVKIRIHRLQYGSNESGSCL